MRFARLVVASAIALSGCAPSSDEPAETGRTSQGQAGGVALGWQSLAPMPTPRTEVVGAAARGKIYVIGGFAESGTVPLVEVYSVADDSWSEGPALPIAVNHAMAATRRGKPYVFGGYRGPGIAKPTRNAYVLRKGKWRALPRMPYPVAAGGAVTIRGKIYVVGGVRRLDRSDGHGLSNRTLRYNPETRKWSKLAPVPTRRQHLGAAASGGEIYVVGGRIQGLQANLATLERGRPWESLPDMPTARGGLAAAASDNGLVLAVGGEEGSGTFEEVEAFDVSEGSWSTLDPLPTARHGLAVVTIGNTLFVIGGGPEPGLSYSGANEALDLGGL